MFCFFFSSRRRHTRCSRDWSSDVCSSDLGADRTTEPATNYAALRGQQDFRKGESGIGVMFTAVNRSLDPLTDAALRHSAYVGALDVRHRFLGSRYQLSGSLDVSQVAGTAAAITATQRDPGP